MVLHSIFMSVGLTFQSYHLYSAMHILLIILCVISLPDFSGYVETRPYILWHDSTSISGYNRGWLECKIDERTYGTQLALDLLIPYDTISLGNVVDNIDIPRLALWLGPEYLRIVAGRQRLYWGVGKIFRPLDIFNPVNYLDPTYERKGVTSFLGFLALGNLTSFRGIYLPAYSIRRSHSGLRIGTNVMSNDVGITVMHRSSETKNIIGAEIAGELEVGYWSEYSFTWEDMVDYSKFVVGIDYSLPLNVYVMVEYYFDGSGEDDPQDYAFTEFLLGERTTLAQQYIYTTIGRMLNPFDPLQPMMNVLVNLNDKGMILIPQINFAVFDNADISVGLNYPFGSDESEFMNITPFDGAVYVWAKVYF